MFYQKTALFVMIELRELCPAVDTKTVYSATRFQDAYFAVDNVIYKKSHVLFEWVRAEFAVNRIEINRTGDFVALSGKNDVVVYSSEGVFQYKESFPKGIRKTLWHPLGVDDACLVVLSAGHVRSLFLGPTKYYTDTFDFTKNPVGAQDSPRFANSMAFGPANAMGDFTLYLATDEGNIFALAPFLPPKFQITVKKYNELLDYAASAFFSNQGSPQEPLYEAQLSWVTSLENQILEPQLKNNDLVYVLDAPDPGMLRSQGPFKVMPYPDQLYECEFGDLTALSYCNMHFLVQSTTNSLIFLQFDEPTPGCWDYSNIGNYDPTLTLVQFLTNVPTCTRLECTESLVWGHGTSSTVLFEPIWLPSLKQNLESGSYSRLERTKFTVFQPSMVYKNNISATAETILDFNTSSTHHYITPPTSVLLFPNQDSQESTEAQKSPAYHNDAINDLKTLLGGISLSPGDPVAGLPDDSVKSLQKMDKIADFYTQEIAKVYKCVDLAFDAIDLQRIELRNQMKMSTDLKQVINNLNLESQGQKVKNILERQKVLQERFRAVEAVANKSTRPDQSIGQLERRWFQELKNQMHTVSQFHDRKEIASNGLKTVNVGGNSELSSRKVQDLRVVLFKLQRLGRDISQMDRSINHASTELETVELGGP